MLFGQLEYLHNPVINKFIDHLVILTKNSLGSNFLSDYFSNSVIDNVIKDFWVVGRVTFNNRGIFDPEQLLITPIPQSKSLKIVTWINGAEGEDLSGKVLHLVRGLHAYDFYGASIIGIGNGHKGMISSFDPDAFNLALKKTIIPELKPCFKVRKNRYDLLKE
jgi:hypothetical protein